MNKLVLASLLAAVAACQPDTKNLERKVDQIQQDQRKIMDMLAKGGGAGGAGAAQPRAPRPEPDRSKTYSVPVDNDFFEGPADAKITVVKAYDYACPYCEKVRGTMTDLIAKYPGELRVVAKQLVVHPRNAMAGALAFCAAGKQGKSKDMDRLIWDKGFNVRQMDLSDVTPAEGQPAGQAQKCWDTADGCKNVVAYAQELQLDMKKFKEDMKACMPIVQKDMKDLQSLAVSATPAFFVNGRYISGAVPIENFSAVIDEEMKKANERIAAGTPKAQYYQQWIVDKGLKTVELPKQ
ncbi:MAG: DsbA family protein [Deltaproteobacteria bacterium]|nr:DsbA family protein [Deltaproteobacteria bacterium]